MFRTKYIGEVFLQKTSANWSLAAQMFYGVLLSERTHALDSLSITGKL